MSRLMDTEEGKEKKTGGAQEEKKQIGYEEAAAAFTEEAGSLISQETIKEVLAEEKKQFLLAEELSISPEKMTGRNLARYSKGLLRHHQPFPFLYEFLGFMMEFMLLLTTYLLGVSGAGFFRNQGAGDFFSEKPFLFAAVLLGGLLLGSRLKKWNVKKVLEQIREKSQEGFVLLDGRYATKKEILGRLMRRHLLTAFVLLAAGTVLCIFFWRGGYYAHYRIDIGTTFLLYVVFALLSGIHNVLYSGHFISFLTIGRNVLWKREEVPAAAEHYKLLRYERMLSVQGKTLADFTSDPLLAEEIMKKMRSDISAYRLYSVVGIFILFVLDVVCVVQIVRGAVTVGMIIFTCVSFLGTFALITTFLSAHVVLRTAVKK